MKLRNCVVSAAAVLLGASMWVAAEEPGATVAPATKPAEPMHAKHHVRGLIKPWSELTGLSDDEKAKIEEIHQASLAEQTRIKDKEQEDILASLTDEQRTQYKDMMEKEAAAKKERAAAMRAAAKKPTTEPTK